MNFNFSVDNLMNSLPIMGKGMLGIFAVTVVIILVVTVLNKVTSGKKKQQ